MIRYRYAMQVQPPAPFVNVSIRCPGTGKQSLNVPALVDTAADRTVLTGHLIEALGLVEDGRLSFQGFAGDVVELPIFLAEVQVHDLPPRLIRAVLGEREPYVLLGRDVLNAHRILLDGPQLALEISHSATG
jgi:gag-polyprotein putative aspartyl protease